MRLCPRCLSTNDANDPRCAVCKEELTAEVAPPALCVRWPGGETEEHLLTRAILRIGRADDNDIVLKFPTLSAHHMRLDITPAGIHCVDLNSTNGTQMHGAYIPPGVPHIWQPGDIVRVSDFTGNSLSFSLRHITTQTGWGRWLGHQSLTQLDRILIGRDPANQMVLPHPTVSRWHTEISRHGDDYLIADLGSGNGTFINGRRVKGAIALNVGDVIQIGPYRLTYDARLKGLNATMSQGHRLDAVGLGVRLASGRMILRDVSLAVQAGEFVALVGGSGAGKTTLLKAMNGYSSATDGMMLIDGVDLYANLGAYRAAMGFVPQDDIIHKELPVRTALRHAARLRLPDAEAPEIEERVDHVLKMVEMANHASKPVRVLSGGQRKRVSIAVELLSEPALLFLDEPTSGLDPGLEKKMMHDLNRLADQGRTVVLVTHATANIEQCHNVAFLSDGYLAYYGPPNQAISFFQARDFADIYLKLSSEIQPERVQREISTTGNETGASAPAPVS